MTDTLKLVFTYLIALTVVVGGMSIIYLTRADAASDVRLLIGGFMGSALTFVFSAEVSSRTAHQQAKAASAATAAQPSAVDPAVLPPLKG